MKYRYTFTIEAEEGEEAEIARIQNAINGALHGNTCAPVPEEAPDEEAIFVEAVDAIEPEAPEKPVNRDARRFEPEVKRSGLISIECPECEARVTVLLKKPATHFQCRCGCKVPLDLMADFTYTCRKCGKTHFGKTNSEAADMTAKCVCGELHTLDWNIQTRRFELRGGRLNAD